MIKVTVLGAGYAGVLTAKGLCKKLKGNAQISIIDKNPFHTMLTELHEVAAGRVSEESIRISLHKIFAGRDIEIITDEIEKINPKAQTLTGIKSSYAYDYLVIATGSKPAFFDVKGVENCYSLWSYHDAVRLRDHIENQFRKAMFETGQEKMKAMLSFYVIGAGLTGVEIAGELKEYTDILCKTYGINPALTKITLADIVERAVTTLPVKVSEKIHRRLRQMDVQLLFGAKAIAVEEKSVTLAVNDIETQYPTETVIWAAGIEGSRLVKESQEFLQKGRGRIMADPFLRAPDYPNIYIAGDNLYYVPEGAEEAVPQMVENCEASAKAVSSNIAGEILGKPLRPYQPKFHGAMVSVGSRWGAAYVGTEKKKFAPPSFIAMLIKHLINILYFLQVAGYNKAFSYMKHEFFTIRHRRSFVGGHFSNVTPSFLFVPLRIYLGFYWLFEGIKKVMEGWLLKPHLTPFFQGAFQFYESVLNPEAVASVTVANDAVTSATEPVIENISSLMVHFNFLGIFQVIIVNGAEIAAKIQIPLVDSLITNIILPYDSVQMFFQYVIVLSEICIGLALMAGLFNFLASSYSLALQGLFITSTGLYMSTWWIIFASMAILIGGGRTFGLDYWLMPWLKEQWKKTKLAGKWYLYHD